MHRYCLDQQINSQIVGPVSMGYRPAFNAYVAVVALLVILLHSYVRGSTAAEAEFKADLLQELVLLRNNVLSFWQHHGLDDEHGGFHGTLDQYGRPVEPTAKGLVQQARHVWAFSTYHLHGHAQTNSTSPAGKHLPGAAIMAQSAYTFMLRHMHDSSDNLWHWNVSREGAVLQSRKVLYGQWFVLYAFSQYYTAFGDISARDLALKTFHTIDGLWHSPEYGGYIENTENGFPAESVGVGIGLREQDVATGFFLRTFNTLLHGIEALTALHKATGDAVVLQRLLELLEIVCTRLQRTYGLVHEEYVPKAGKAPWAPAPDTTVNYGHNLEASWLILDTLDYLRSIRASASFEVDPDWDLSVNCTSTAVTLGTAASHTFKAVTSEYGIAGGYDQQHGGVYEWGTATAPVSKVKVWWVQAEAMLAFWKLHSFYKGLGKVELGQEYLQKLVETTGFVKKHLMDGEGGEQYWRVEADGTWQASGDADKDTKGNRWKAAYHSSRAPLFLEKWIRETAEAESV